jgi:folate-dependent phosphoribosylglycinamide formyltransferase PurN
MGARAIIQAREERILEEGISVVVFDQPSPMQEYCDTHRIPYLIKTRNSFNEGFIEAKSEFRLDCLGLTFNKILSRHVIDHYNERIFNLHMSLLPMFPGFGATRKAIETNQKTAGVTIHLIDEGVDTGPILAQRPCKVLPNDTVESLGRRQFEAALPLLLQTVRNVSNGELAPFDTIDLDLLVFADHFCRSI